MSDGTFAQHLVLSDAILVDTHELFNKSVHVRSGRTEAAHTEKVEHTLGHHASVRSVAGDELEYRSYLVHFESSVRHNANENLMNKRMMRQV